MKTTEQLNEESAICRKALTHISLALHEQIRPLRRYHDEANRRIMDHLQLTVGLKEMENVLDNHSSLKGATKSRMFLERKKMIALAKYTAVGSKEWIECIKNRKT